MVCGKYGDFPSDFVEKRNINEKYKITDILTVEKTLV